MKAMRGKMKAMADEIRQKEARFRLLAEEYEKMPKNINRGQYTHRIMNIIKQVRKQNEEIDRIIEDILNVRQEINMVSDRLARTETLAEESMWHIVRSKTKQKGEFENYRQVRLVQRGVLAGDRMGGGWGA
jgi:hypothetical protein